MNYRQLQFIGSPRRSAGAFFVLMMLTIIACGTDPEIEFLTVDLTGTEVDYQERETDIVSTDLDLDAWAQFTWASKKSIYVAYGNASPRVLENPNLGPRYGKVDLESDQYLELENFLPNLDNDGRICTYGDLRMKSPNQVIYLEACADSFRAENEVIVVGIANGDRNRPPIEVFSPSVFIQPRLAWAEKTGNLIILNRPDIDTLESSTPVLYEVNLEMKPHTVSNGTELTVPDGMWITDFDFSADGKLIVFAGTENRRVVANPNLKDSLWLYEIETGIIRMWDLKLENIDVVRWSPTGNFLAVKSRTKGITVFDFQTGKWHQLENNENPPWTVSWSPDGSSLAVIGWGGLGKTNFVIYDLDDILK